MASRYWVGGSGTWDTTTTTHWSASSGGSGGASAPTSVDDVFFDTNSSASGYTVSYSTALSCNNLSISAPASGNLTMSGVDNMITINGTALTLYSGWIQSRVRFTTTSSGTVTITTNGGALPDQLIMNGTGTVSMADNVTVGQLFHIKGTFTTNNHSLTAALFWSTGNFTRVMNFGSSAISFQNAQIWGQSFTVNAGTSTMSITGPATFATTLGPFTAYNLNFGNAANKTDFISLSGNLTVSNTFAANGNSITNRLLVQSDTLGTARTITAATVGTCSNVDFMDITGAGAGSWNLSSISGGSGDCGGNSGITFTTGQNNYWKHGGTSQVPISTAANWYLATNGGGGAGRYPLPQDVGLFDSNSFSTVGCVVYQDMPRVGGIDWTGSTNSPTWNWNAISGPSVAFTIFGSMTLVSGMNPGLLWGYNSLTLGGRGSYNITTAGNVLTTTRLFLACPGGTYTQQDNFNDSFTIAGGSCQFNPIKGTWNSNGYNTTFQCMDGSYTYGTITSSTATLTMGSGTWTMNGNDSTFGVTTWRATAGMTINAGTSTLLFSDSSSNTKTMYGGGKTYYNLTWGGSGTGTFSVNDSGTTFIGTTAISCTGAAQVALFGTTGITHGNIDFTGFVGTWVGTNAGSFSGNFKLVPAMTLSYAGVLTSTTSGTANFTSAGKTFSVRLDLSGTGTVVFQDDYNNSASGIRVNRGTFDGNDKNFTMSIFQANVSGVTLGNCVLNLKSGTYSLSSTTPLTFVPLVGSFTLTLNAGTSTIKYTNNSATNKLFNPNGLTFYNFWNATLGTGYLAVQGSGNYTNFISNPGRTMVFYTGFTTALASASGWQASGTAGNVNILKSNISGSTWNISCPTGTINADYISLQDSHAFGGATFNAGSNSTNVSNNSGWNFGGAPPPFSNPGGFYAAF